MGRPCCRELPASGDRAAQALRAWIFRNILTNHRRWIAVPEREHSLARTLGRTHSEFALAVNRANRRSGHIWQNRSFSCPMSESHLLTALQYVERNPVRAKLAANAWDWPWSSARAHVAAGFGDGLLCPGAEEHLGRWDHGEWKELLAAGFQTRVKPQGRPAKLRESALAEGA